MGSAFKRYCIEKWKETPTGKIIKSEGISVDDYYLYICREYFASNNSKGPIETVGIYLVETFKNYNVRHNIGLHFQTDTTKDRWSLDDEGFEAYITNKELIDEPEIVEEIKNNINNGWYLMSYEWSCVEIEVQTNLPTDLDDEKFYPSNRQPFSVQYNKVIKDNFKYTGIILKHKQYLIKVLMRSEIIKGIIKNDMFFNETDNKVYSKCYYFITMVNNDTKETKQYNYVEEQYINQEDILDE